MKVGCPFLLVMRVGLSFQFFLYFRYNQQLIEVWAYKMKKLNLKNLEPRVLVIPEMKLVAKGMTMSFAADRTFDLWRSFSPLIKDIDLV